MLLKKTLNHAIIHKKCQYWNKGVQFPLYIREEKGVIKNSIFKAIPLEFSFLIKQFKLLITASTNAAMVNIKVAIIYRALNIDKRM